MLDLGSVNFAVSLTDVPVGLVLLAVASLGVRRPVQRVVARVRSRRAVRIVRIDPALPPAPVRRQIEAKQDIEKVP